MAYIYGKEISKMKLVFTDIEGKSVSQTISNLKYTAQPGDILLIASKLATLNKNAFNYVTKITEAEVINS